MWWLRNGASSGLGTSGGAEGRGTSGEHVRPAEGEASCGPAEVGLGVTAAVEGDVMSPLQGVEDAVEGADKEETGFTTRVPMPLKSVSDTHVPRRSVLVMSCACHNKVRPLA